MQLQLHPIEAQMMQLRPLYAQLMQLRPIRITVAADALTGSQLKAFSYRHRWYSRGQSGPV